MSKIAIKFWKSIPVEERPEAPDGEKMPENVAFASIGFSPVQKTRKMNGKDEKYDFAAEKLEAEGFEVFDEEVGEAKLEASIALEKVWLAKFPPPPPPEEEPEQEP